MEVLEWYWKCTNICLETWFPSSQAWRNVIISDFPHLWFLWFESTGASVEGTDQLAVALDLVRWCSSRNKPTCTEQHVLSWTVCFVLDNRLIGQKGPSCLGWMCASRDTGQTVPPGFAGFALQNHCFQIQEGGGTILPHFWRDTGIFAPYALSYWKRGWKSIGMAVQIKIYCVVFPNAVGGLFGEQQMGESGPVWEREWQREILEIIWNSICTRSKWMSHSWISC